MIVLAGAALRVADLCRYVDQFQGGFTHVRKLIFVMYSEVKPYKTKDIDVAKLFAKHFKVSEHVEYLDKTKVGVAVGTAGRIGKLLSETGSRSS